MIFIIRSLNFKYFRKQIRINFGICLIQLMLLILDHRLVLDRSYMICICFKPIINYLMIRARIFIVKIISYQKIIFRLSLSRGIFICWIVFKVCLKLKIKTFFRISINRLFRLMKSQNQSLVLKIMKILIL